MNRRSKRTNKKKAIPLYFQKSHSNSQFLITANYKHQIKLLKKTNKELASSLQDIRCRAADQERALAECNRENTQMMFVKMKIKDIVETVQKLVTDLGEVYDVIDGKSFDFLKNCSASHQEARLQIRNPSISTIEESASSSIIEQDLNKEENLCIESSTIPPRNNLPSVTPSFFDADSSRTEIYNVPLVLASEQKLQNVSNENQSAVTRSSKSLERTGSTPLDPDSPPTPQPPVLPPNFQLSIESRSLLDLSKLKPITTTESKKSADFLKPQLITSPFAIKNAGKSTISKIPVKKPTASINSDSPQLSIPSDHMNRRKTFVVEEKDEEPQRSLPPSDRRGTFVLKSSADNAKSDIISDRRGTFVLNTLADNTKSEEIFDRRATYFIPSQPEEQPDSSPPKAVENHIPVQNAAPNQTILLCEDMELTEIIPIQNQSHQFIPSVPLWNEKLETKQTGLSGLKFSASVSNQISCANSLVKQFPASNINSSKQFEISTTHEFAKEAKDQNAVSVKKNEDNKSLVSFVVPKTELLTKVTAPAQDVNSTDSQQKRNKEKDVIKKISNKEINTNIKCPAKELPSPIATFVKPDMSIQEKIFHSISGINALSDKNKQALDTIHLTEDDRKKSTALKRSLSKNQFTVEKIMVNEVVESLETGRKSSRKQNICYDQFFSDSEESDADFDIDFMAEKRFSLKPGRKIINPNNNKVFVFKKNLTNQCTDNDIPTDKSLEEDAKIDQEKDVFNFSTSSDAGKSPLKKHKKRKSVMPNSKKRSVNKQYDVDKKLSKRMSKRNSKPEVNQDEVPVVAHARKSILNLNKDNCPLPLKSNRKSVRFTLVGITPQDEINHPDCDSSNEINVTPDNEESNDIHNIESESSGNSLGKRLSSKKKYISARSNSLKATGDIVKRSSSKSKKSRKRDSLEDVCESDCSPTKKVFQESKEVPPQNTEICNNLSCEKQEQNKDFTDKFELLQGKTGSVSSELPEEKPINTKKDEIEKTDTKNVKRPFSGVSERISNKKQSIVDDLFPSKTEEMKPVNVKKEKNSCKKLSELSSDIDVNKVKRPFSGVSERVSNKKQSIVDDLFPELDDAICEIVDKKMETSLKMSEDGPNKIYSIKEAGKSIDSNCNKGDLVTPKTSKQKSDCGKKKNSKKKKACPRQSKDKENTPNNAERFFKLDVLTSDNNLPFGSKESAEKVVPLKKSKKKKESTCLLQNDLKTDVLSSENAIVPDEVASGRPRRNRPVISLKEPSINTKMRRE